MRSIPPGDISTGVNPPPGLGVLLVLAALGGCSQVAAVPRAHPDEAPSSTAPSPPPATPSDEVERYERALIQEFEDDLPVVVLDHTPSTRLLRGDFEPPQTLVVVYEPDWRHSVEQIVAAARGQSDVILLVLPEDEKRPTVRKLRKESHVRVVEARLDSPWVRDYGPLQTYDLADGLVWLDYGYGWDRPKDDTVPQTLFSLLPALELPPLQAENVALDGGAVISNGKGLCAMTEVSLTDAGVSMSDAPALQDLLRTLGCPTLAILPEIPDETTGHADVVAQFLSPTLAVVASADPRSDLQLAETLEETTERLLEAADLGRQKLDIVRLPMEVDGETFYSYVNSTRLEDRLLVPHFDRVSRHTQRVAYGALRASLPGVELIPIGADQMAERGGAVHCVTLGLGAAHRRPAELARPGGRPKPRG